MKSERKGVGIKIETVPGTEAAPVGATDYLAAVDFKWNSPGKPAQDSFDYASGALGDIDPFTVSMYRECEFSLPLVSSGAPVGTAYPAPWAALFRACGHAVTVTAVTDVKINPVSTGEESATIHVNEDGFLRKLIYARGSLSALLEEGKVGRFTASLMGLYSTPSDATMPTITLPAVQKPVGFNKANTTVTLGALALKCKRVAINGGRTHNYRNLAGQEDVVVDDCKPTVKISFELPTAAQKNVYGDLETTVSQALSIAHNTVVGNRCNFTAARAILMNITESKDRGMLFVEADFQLKPTVLGNDHYLWTMT